MRYLIIVLLITGCAAQPKSPPHLSLDQLRRLTVSQQDCANKDIIINKLEEQQLNAGIARIDPEYLTDPAREYQARIRTAIWALRIGCSNPDRYKVL